MAAETRHNGSAEGATVIFESYHTIGGVRVEVGAVITEAVTSRPILGRQVKVGAVCEAMEPQAWRAIIAAESSRVWASDSTFASFDEASRAAREHFRDSVDRALRDLFAT